MRKIHSCTLSQHTLLIRYKLDNHYADCFSTHIDRAVSLQQFIEAFYTTPLFKLERVLLKLFVAKPSTDEQAAQVAGGDIDSFSAWTVEQRAADQLLMCDISGNTRSWFMVSPIEDASASATQLHFGSAVIPSKHKKTGEYRLGLLFRLLLGFHKLYSIALLASARRKLLAALR